MMKFTFRSYIGQYMLNLQFLSITNTD